MSRFKKLQDYKKRFDTMDVAELKDWRDYWTYHAQQLAPKVRKQALKRIREIDEAIEHLTADSDKTGD